MKKKSGAGGRAKTAGEVLPRFAKEEIRYVIFAAEAGQKIPFEVSKEVNASINPLCPTSPFCPGERTPRVFGSKSDDGKERVSAATVEFSEDFEYDPRVCPYGYEDKNRCYVEVNRAAIKEGSFSAPEMRRTANFLKALGYRVKAERIGSADLAGERILMAHGPIYNFHELRCERGPGGLVLYLIRDPVHDESPTDCIEL